MCPVPKIRVPCPQNPLTCVISFLRIWWKLSWVRFRICFVLSFTFHVISRSEISARRRNRAFRNRPVPLAPGGGGEPPPYLLVWAGSTSSP